MVLQAVSLEYKLSCLHSTTWRASSWMWLYLKEDLLIRCPHWFSSKIQMELRRSSLEQEDLRRCCQHLRTRKFTSPIQSISRESTIRDGWWLWLTGAGGKLLVLEFPQGSSIQQMDLRTRISSCPALLQLSNLRFLKVLLSQILVILSLVCSKRKRIMSLVSAELIFKTSSKPKGRRSLPLQEWRQSTSQAKE